MGVFPHRSLLKLDHILMVALPSGNVTSLRTRLEHLADLDFTVLACQETRVQAAHRPELYTQARRLGIELALSDGEGVGALAGVGLLGRHVRFIRTRPELKCLKWTQEEGIWITEIPGDLMQKFYDNEVFGKEWQEFVNAHMRSMQEIKATFLRNPLQDGVS